MREVITVPFSKKKEAIELGAEFNTSDRKWYITDKTEFDNHEKLRHLADVETQEIAIDLPEEVPSLAAQESQIEDDPFSGTTQTDIEKEENFDWAGILDSRDSMKIAMTLRDHNVPKEEADRVKMLEILNIRTPGNYPFTYDGMINLSENFEKAYPPEKIQTLAMKLTSPGNYMMRIRNSDLSAEEKALMYFVLPIGAE